MGCFEERPCFLPGEVAQGLAPQAGNPAKEPYAYAKHGRCGVRAAVEPLPGQRRSPVRARRTKRADTPFRQQLAARYPQATKIRLVLDNLTPHALRTFYDCLPAALAPRLADCFAVSYPPKGGSWLHQMELDFWALSRQGLPRRLPPQAPLAHQVYGWSGERQAPAGKIHWHFPIADARQTLNSHYQKVLKGNRMYRNTSSTV